MSKRHQSSRRKVLRPPPARAARAQRPDRRHHDAIGASTLDECGRRDAVDPLAFLDPRAPRLRFGLGD